jgi:hypothetical protein
MFVTNKNKQMKVGEVLNPAEVGQRGFDPQDLFNNIRRLQTVWCWGAHAWTVNKDKFLRFKSEGFLHKGHVYIILGWDDTFTVILTSVRGKVISIDEGIYVDMLVQTIDRRIERK